MDCNKILLNLSKIERLAQRASRHLGAGNSTGVNNSLIATEILIRAIRAELNDVKGKR